MKLILVLSCLLLAKAQYYPKSRPCEDCTSDLCFEPHPHNCSQYYVCNNDRAIVMKCPANLQFNPLINVCDYPEHVGCIDTPKPTMKTNIDTLTNIKSEPNEEVKCHESEDGEAVIIPNPDDCSKFYICVGTNPVAMKCKPPTLFNPDLSVCDWPENVTCA